jgi:hypothetical protein
MPKVGKKKFPYTKMGFKEAYKAAEKMESKAKKKMEVKEVKKK